MVLSDGYSVLAPGKLASVVTCMEMLSAAPLRPENNTNAWMITSHEKPNLQWYKTLYERVGSNWLWFSRLFMAEDQLLQIIQHPDVEVYAFSINGKDVGLLELDFRQAGECELVYLGLTSDNVGQGAGRWLMNRALEKAWEHSIRRFWVHTCTLDHPKALDFYLRSGFVPFKRQIEIADDPRVTGKLPKNCAPHIPII